MSLKNANIIQNRSPKVISDHEITVGECIEEVSILSQEIFLQLKSKLQKLNVEESKLKKYVDKLEGIHKVILENFHSKIKIEKDKLGNYKNNLYTKALNY